MKSQKAVYLLLLIFLSFACERDEKNTSISKPNIVLFFVDDMGWQDTSVPFWDKTTAFNEIYRTPNMERLANEGMKFTQAYATSVCSPTRISLLTGMNAARHRVTNWTLYKNKMQPMEEAHATLQFPRWNVNGVSPDPGLENAVYATTFPSLLQEEGYYTIHSGKAHFAAIGTPGEDPRNLGFDVNIAGHAAGAPRSYLGEQNFGSDSEIWGVPGLEKYHGEDIFLTEVLTREALQAVDTALRNEQPFFLYMAHYAVHTPIMGDNRFLEKYLELGMDSTEAKYATLVEGMDKSLGDIMDYLEAKNLVDNTIILFMSDNGGLSAVARGGEKHSHNKPLASGKGSAYEGGIREPMIVKWPGKVKPKTTNDTYLIIEDFFPTILQMAGIEVAETVQEIDGISFIPTLKGEKVDGSERALFWHYPNEWGPSGPGIGASSSVRKGDWKFLYFHEDRRMELFNLKDDIGETLNLHLENPEKARELAAILSDYLKEVDAQMPVDKRTNKAVEYPIELL
jgi:arylsulfatase A-like enzyme